MSSLSLGGQPAPDFSKGGSGPSNPYDTSPAGLGITPAYLASQTVTSGTTGSDAWVALGATLTYSSTDGHTFVATTGSDVSGTVSAGDRIRCADSGSTEYFIVTFVNATTIKLYGGTSYSLSGGAISAPYYSHAKNPYGFPLDPTKWTETVTSSSSTTKASAANGTWYGDTGLSATGPSLAIPIGAWKVWYKVTGYASSNSDLLVSLSTSSNSESDSDLSSFMSGFGSQQTVVNQKDLVLASKTTYYLVCMSDNAGGSATIGFRGDLAKSIIRAVCAYL